MIYAILSLFPSCVIVSHRFSFKTFWRVSPLTVLHKFQKDRKRKHCFFNVYVMSQGLMSMSLVQSDHFHQLTSTGAWWGDQRWQENAGSHLWNTLSGTVSTCRSHRNHCQVLRLASLNLGMRGECSSHLLNKIQMAVGSHWAGCNTQQCFVHPDLIITHGT